MVEIEDRGATYKSWKFYAKALQMEVKCLQQLLPSNDVKMCHESVLKRIGQEPR